MDIVFQQDGAPPHWATVVRDYMDGTFDGNWCGRSGPVMWPPNSPDLTPPDFFLWGFMKNDVYSQRPMDIDDLKEGSFHVKCPKIKNGPHSTTSDFVENLCIHAHTCVRLLCKILAQLVHWFQS